MRSAVAVLTVIVVMGMGAWWLWSSPASEPDADASVTERSGPADAPLSKAEAVRFPTAGSTEVEGEQPGADDRSAAVATRPLTDLPSSSSAPSPGQDDRWFEGRVLLLDEEGYERPAPNGSLHAYWLSDRDDEGAELFEQWVDVRGGRFTIEEVEVASITVEDAQLDGRWAVLESSSPTIGEAPVVVRCRWPRPHVVRLLVVDEDGQDRGQHDGSFRPYWEHDRRRDEPRIQVVDGCCLVDSAHPLFRMEDLVLDGRAAVPVEDLLTPGIEEGLVRCRWLPATTLHVHGPEGRDLGDVVVFSLSSPRRPSVPFAREDRSVLAAGPSPLLVERPGRHRRIEGRQEVLIGAPGYAWVEESMNFADGGEFHVQLEPGGGLEVRIVGSTGPTPEDPEQAPFLRLRELGTTMEDLGSLEDFLAEVAARPTDEFDAGVRPSVEVVREEYDQLRYWIERMRGPLVAETPASSNILHRWGGIAAGEYVVAVEIGDWWDAPRVLGETRARVEVGSTTEVSLEVEAPRPPDDPVPFAGTLSLGAHWAGKQPSMILDPLDLRGQMGAEVFVDFDELQVVDGNERMLRWDAGRVPPGRYLISIGDLDAFVVDTGARGRTDVALEVADLAVVEVRVVDDRTGAPITDVEPWCSTARSGVPGFGGSAQARPRGEGRYEFEVPAGPVLITADSGRHVQLDDDGHAGGVRRDLRVGLNQIVLRLRRTCGVQLQLQENGQAREVDGTWLDEARLEGIEHGGRATSRGTDDHGAWIRVSRAGRYRVHLPELEGFEPVPPFEVVVSEGEYPLSVVELRPR